jgi:hypothetical protein
MILLIMNANFNVNLTKVYLFFNKKQCLLLLTSSLNYYIKRSNFHLGNKTN